MTDKQDADFEKGLSRLLGSALEAEASPLSEREVNKLVKKAVAAHTTYAVPEPAFPLWAIVVSVGCLVVLTVLGGFSSQAQPVAQLLTVAIVFANLLLSPLAAVAIIQRRRLSDGY